MDHLGRMGFSEEQADLLDVAESFCRERSSMEKVRALLDEDNGYDPAVWKEISELGWLGIAVPEMYGGAGLSLAEVVPVMEAMGRNLLAGPFMATTLAAQAVLDGGTDAQKSEWLPKLASGTVATIALTETSGRWDDSDITATAVESGDRVALSGVKTFVADAAAADVIFASVSLKGAPALVLIETTALSADALRRETVIDETRRSYELRLDGVSIPSSSIMDVDRAKATLMRLRLAANLLGAAEMVGGNRAVIDYTIEYLNTRKQFGKLIGAYQGLKHPTVDAYTMFEQARSHLYAAAHCFNEQGTGEIATRMATAQAEKSLAYAADRAIQFHGGFGFTYECDAHLYRRRAIWHGSQFGDAAWQKEKLAALLL